LAIKKVVTKEYVTKKRLKILQKNNKLNSVNKKKGD